MPALALESLLPLESSDEHGVCAKDGKLLMARKISDGQKQLASSYLFSTLSGWEDHRNTSKSTGTIKGLLKAGGTDAAETQPSMKSFVESSSLSTIPLHLIHFTPRTSLAKKTPQTIPPEESMATQTTYCQISPFPRHSNHSLHPQIRESTVQTESNQLPPRNLLATVTMRPPKKTQVSLVMRSITSTRDNSIPSNTRFSASLLPDDIAKPLPYKTGLIPIPSQLRPHCLARERLKLWFLSETRIARGTDGRFLAIAEEDLQRVLTVMNLSWAPGTRECYGAGLLVFHVFCDERDVPEEQRCPVETQTMLNFVASCAGSYSGKTIVNYVYAVKAWHTLHGQSTYFSHFPV